MVPDHTVYLKRRKSLKRTYNQPVQKLLNVKFR